MRPTFYVGQELFVKEGFFKHLPRGPWIVIRFFDRIAGCYGPTQPERPENGYYIDAKMAGPGSDALFSESEIEICEAPNEWEGNLELT